MWGWLRFFLVFCVVAFHLTGTLPNLGQLSVVFLYVISGFWITYVLHESYKFESFPFLINRFLRLYPAYIIVALITIIMHQLPLNAYDGTAFHASWTNQASTSDILANIFMIPWAWLGDSLVPVDITPSEMFTSSTQRYRLVPSTWAVSIELVAYLILLLFTAKTWKTASITIFAALLWHVAVGLGGLDLRWRYFPVPAAMLPIALGSLGYFAVNKININRRSKIIDRSATYIIAFCLIILLFSLNWLLSATYSNQLYTSIFYYLNMPIALWGVIRLRDISFRGWDWIRKWDSVLGDLAYPMFLNHYLGGFIVWQLLGRPSTVRSVDLFLLSLPVILLLSIIIVILEQPVTKLRNKIRSANASIRAN